MADGQLYGVHNGKFYKRSPPAHHLDNWLGSANLIGSGGWSVFKFLMAPLKLRTVIMATKKSAEVETLSSCSTTIPDYFEL